MSYSSRLPQISAGLAARADAIASTAANMLMVRAKARVPVATGALRDAIHVDRNGIGDYAVIAGNRDVFYGHIVEHGGAHRAARPFMVPAAEEVRGELPALINAGMRNL